MINSLFKNILIFCLPFILALILTPLVRILALKNKLIDRPTDQRFHRRVTALLGGVGIFIASFIGISVFVPLEKGMVAYLAGAIFIFFWGLCDDFKPMKPPLKLLGQIIASCIVISLGIYFRFLENQLLSYLLTIFWIIGITNAFNLLDNMDGLAAGTAAICSLMVFISSLMLHNNGIGSLALILAASALGFLPYNFNPAKIYMGDSGSMFLGFSMATISIIGSHRHLSNVMVTLAIPVLILAVPIFDTLFVMVMRNIGGRSFWIGGKDHTSHRLVSLGLSERKTVILLYSLSFLFGLVALLYTKIDIIIVVILSVLTIIILLFFGIFLSEVKTYDKLDELDKARKKKQISGNVVLNTVLLHKRNFLEVVVDLVLICLAYYSSYLLKYDGNIPQSVFRLISESLPLIISIKLVAFFCFGIYSRIWPYMGISDVISIFKAVSSSSLLSIVAVTFVFRFIDYSRAIFILDWLILIFLVTGIRLAIPVFSEYFFSARTKEKNILIFGAGNTGEAFLREIKRDKNLKYHPVGFIDDDRAKIGKKIRGIPVLGARNNLSDIIKSRKIDTLFVAIPTLGKEDFQLITSLCRENGVNLRKINRIFDFEEVNEK